MDDPTEYGEPPAIDESRSPDAPLTAPLGTPAPPIERQEWHVLHLWQIQMVRDVLIIGGILGLVYLGYLLSIVTVPLLLALTLAYLFEPVVRRLTGRWSFFSRGGVAVGILVIGGALVIVPATLGVGFAIVQGAAFAGQVSETITAINDAVEGRRPIDSLAPRYRRVTVQLQRMRLEEQAEERRRGPAPDAPPAGAAPVNPPAALPGPSGPPEAGAEPVALSPQDGPPSVPAEDPSGGEQAATPSVAETVETVSKIRLDDLDAFLAWTIGFVQANAEAISKRVLGTGAGAFDAAINTFTSIGMFLFLLFLTGFFFYFVCTGYGAVMKFWDELIPERKRGRVFYLLGKMDRVISGFVRGRLVVCACLVLIFILGYWLVGVPAPLILGAVVGILAVVPYVALVGIPVSIALMWFDPPGGWRGEMWWIFVGPIAVYVIGQALDDYVLTPVIQGKSTGMDTPTILFASLAGGALAGFYGLLLAVPVAACLKILVQEIFLPRMRAWVAGRVEDFLPIAKD